jgi:glycogen debranching enzyme
LDEIIRVKDKFYISATSSLTDDRTRVLKEGETFAVFDRHGDIRPIARGVHGVYHEGTRFLSRLELYLDQHRPVLLSSTVKNDNAVLSVDLTNPDASPDGDSTLPRGTIHFVRTKFLWQGACYESVTVSNFGLVEHDVAVMFRFEADFADIFEVRGLRRPYRGRRLKTTIDQDRVVLGYQGLDGLIRRTRLQFTPTPTEVLGSEIRFAFFLQPKEERTLYLTVCCDAEDESRCLPYDDAHGEVSRAVQVSRTGDCDLYTSNEQFNDWLNRSAADLHMMVTGTSTGPYPYAGVPWYSTPFGRDGLITALQFLWVNPSVSRGVLAYLGATQATDVIPEQDAEPGKILHETRRGEMAALGEIPFGRYYGTVDATPLFIIVAAGYFARTGDLPFIASMWPHIDLALKWLDTYGDMDSDGFVEYARHSANGLVQQGWKDSGDSVFHSDGTLAQAPIALCEVQGYTYAAKLGAADLAAALGHPSRASELKDQAGMLKRRFEEAFWCEELETYALALDGDKRPCRVRTSNAGHCLFTGIAEREHGRRAAATLLAPDSFSGWGVRTLSASEVRYNPMSYHNGSIWPHDNALIADGLARYGMREMSLRILTGLFDASLFVDLHRLPELFCGFERRVGEGPTLYPVACAPQAWAAASVFMLLQSCLGLTVDGVRSHVTFLDPVMPSFLEDVRIKNLSVGKALVDLRIHGHDRNVNVEILRMEGHVEVDHRQASR